MSNLNSLLIGRFASLESDVPNDDVEVPAVNRELGDDDSGNPLDASASTETALSEADEHLADFERADADVEELVETSDSLESFLLAAQQVRKQGGWTTGEASAIQLGLSAALKRVGGTGEEMMPSLESFERQRVDSTASVENAITDALKKIWDAIKRTVNKVVTFVRKWYLKILDGASRLKKRAEAIRKKAENTSGSKKENKVRSGVLRTLHVDRKMPTSEVLGNSIEEIAALVSGATESRLASTYGDTLDGLCKTVEDMVNEGNVSNEASNSATSRPYMGSANGGNQGRRLKTKEVEEVIKGLFTWWFTQTEEYKKGLENIRNEQLKNSKSPLKNMPTDYFDHVCIKTGLPGGKQAEFMKGDAFKTVTNKLLDDAGDDQEKVLKAMSVTEAASRSAMVIYFVDSSDKKVEIDEASEVVTLDVGDVIKLCDAVITFADKVIDYKKGFENYEKRDKAILSKMDKISSKSLDKVADSPAVAKAVRHQANIAANSVRGNSKAITGLIDYGMRISVAALQYCTVSLGQYKD